jgi:uncharacterized protein
MPAQRTYPAGVPCWVQLETIDTAPAADFYAGLFGWAFTGADPRDPGSFLFARLDGQDVGAQQRSAAPEGWVSFIACDDVEAACDAVTAAGGTVVAAPDAGSPFGRGATCADPQGAVFHLWQPGSHPGSQVVNSPGAWNFSDLHTPDPGASLAFYGAVFGWEQDAGLGAGMIRLAGYGDHLAATIDPEIFARQASAPPGFADVVAALTEDPVPARWSIRFSVADRDESIRAVEEGGGRLLSMADTEWTREAVVSDPAGAEFVLSQFAPRG